ncbi:MAG: hypothetical protein WC495_06685 [Patescibacteria group bacterium]|jgi:hypothetical protein
MHLLLIEPDIDVILKQKSLFKTEKKKIRESKVIKYIAPNLAMLKWATWAENNGHTYQYVIGKKHIFQKEPDLILISCIFSFYSKEYTDIINYYRETFRNAKFIIGGAFPTLNPEWFKAKFPYAEIHQGIRPEIEDLVPNYAVTPWSKKIIGYASRGCVNACKYCAVSKLEGKMRSFPTIRPMIEKGIKEIGNPTGIVLYDNNFTAHEYFDNICDELEEFGLPVDIHGLHVSAFNEHHAERFARLKWGAQHEAGTAYMRFSFDFVGYQPHIHRALKLVEKHKIKAAFFCYMLFNWVDSPDDFWKRIVQAQEMTDDVSRTIFLFPQRFEPLDSLERNKFVGTKWDKELVAGVVKLYTFMHGFLPVTTSHNIFNWIGYTKEEFFDNARKFATDKTFKLVKKNGDPPKTFKL